MERSDGWEQDLEGFLLSRVAKPFKWSANDCCSFAFDSIESITGVDVGEVFRGRYRGRGKAFKLLEEHSGGSIAETWEKLADEYGMEQIEPSELKAGDVATIKIKPLDPVAGRLSNGISVGVKAFTRGFVSPGKDGLVLNENPEVVKAWRVGE